MSSKIFYVGFQRCGTKSFKSIISQNGFKTVSWQECESNRWDVSVLNGDYENVVKSNDFNKSDYYEDFPFQVLHFIEYLSNYYPKSKFIHVERNPIDWFESMVSHSGGKNPGVDDCKTHAMYYDRMDLWNYLRKSLGRNPRSLPIIGFQEHYTKFYVRENLKIINFLKSNLSKDRYFLGNLEDKDLYTKICDFIKLPPTQPITFHKSNKEVAIEKLKNNFPFL